MRKFFLQPAWRLRDRQILDRWRRHMGDLAGLCVLNRVEEGREERTIVFHSVLQNVDDYNTEAQLCEVVFMLKTLVDGHENVAMALGLSDQLGVWGVRATALAQQSGLHDWGRPAGDAG